MRSLNGRFGEFELYNKKHVSGLKVFDGEDLEYQDRKQFQQMQQNEWFKQQLYENQKADEEQKRVKQQLAEQDLANYRMHCLRQAEHEQNVRNTNEQTLDYNRLLAECRREKELKDKKEEEDLDRRNYLDAEETRDFAYANLKETIDHIKKNILIFSYIRNI